MCACELRFSCAGQSATVKDVVYLEGQVPNKDLPAFIVVECLKYSVPQFFEEEHKKNWIPLPPSTFQDDSFSASRTGYALLTKVRENR